MKKNSAFKSRFMIYSSFAALLVLMSFSIALRIAGPLSINIAGHGIPVTDMLPPFLIAIAIWFIGSLAPILLSNRLSITVIIVLLAANIVYNELHLQTPVEVMNPECNESILAGEYKNFNFLLISLDTLRADRLHYYGYSRKTSPAIDMLAARSCTFMNAFSHAPSTLPSHASMFTGLYPGANMAKINTRTALPDEAVTIAELFRETGYTTAAFTGGGQLSSEWGLDQGFDTYYDDGFGFEQVWPEAKKWFDGFHREKFFVFLHSYNTHAPYDPPPPYDTMFDPDYKGWIPARISPGISRAIHNGEKEVNERDIYHINAIYDGAIRHTDNYISKIVGYLKKRGLSERTVIILTSDHGEEFNDHGIIAMHAHTLYDELLHVPLIVHLPGREGVKIINRVGIADIVPTTLRLAGIDITNRKFQGSSFERLIASEKDCTTGARFLFAEKEHHTGEKYGRLKSVRSEKWKFIMTTPKPRSYFVKRILGDIIYSCKSRELYNTQKDPDEKDNLACKLPGVSRLMEKATLKTIQWNQAVQLKANENNVRMDGQLRKQFKDLGYLK